MGPLKLNKVVRQIEPAVAQLPVNAASIREERKNKIIITRRSYRLAFHRRPNWSSFKINKTFNWTPAVVISARDVNYGSFNNSSSGCWMMMEDEAAQSDWWRIICLGSPSYFRGSAAERHLLTFVLRGLKLSCRCWSEHCFQASESAINTDLISVTKYN